MVVIDFSVAHKASPFEGLSEVVGVEDFADDDSVGSLVPVCSEVEASDLHVVDLLRMCSQLRRPHFSSQLQFKHPWVIYRQDDYLILEKVSFEVFESQSMFSLVPLDAEFDHR